MQIGYVICLANDSNKVNIIYWLSNKCKRVTESVLALDLYIMIDVGAIFKLTIEKIIDIKVLSLIVCTNSKLLYDYLVWLGTT